MRAVVFVLYPFHFQSYPMYLKHYWILENCIAALSFFVKLHSYVIQTHHFRFWEYLLPVPPEI